jgi:two-component system, OmpR family, KDP operon response regulator KdpE
VLGRIVVASGDIQRRKELRAALEFEGHQVAEAETAHATLHETCSKAHDVLLLDSEIEGAKLHELCRAIRPQSDLGIIVLNRDNTGQSRIDALNSGADDCVPPPFVMAELLARVRAMLRRLALSHVSGQPIVLEDRAIDLSSRKVKGPDGALINLTPKEFLVLQQFLAHCDKPLTHRNLAQAVWQRDGQGEVEYLRIVIKQLRRKLEPDPARPRYIVTERSFGYRFQMHPSEPGARSRHRVLKSAPAPSLAVRSDSPAMAR